MHWEYSPNDILELRLMWRIAFTKTARIWDNVKLSCSESRPFSLCKRLKFGILIENHLISTQGSLIFFLFSQHTLKYTTSKITTKVLCFKKWKNICRIQKSKLPWVEITWFILCVQTFSFLSRDNGRRLTARNFNIVLNMLNGRRLRKCDPPHEP